jgi:hypothetical protein
VTSLATSSYDRTRALFPSALVRLCARAQRELWGLRLTRVYGVGVGISYALLALGIGSEPQLAAALWARCLSTASWVAGVGALSLARDIATRDEMQGVTSLARLRGFGDRALERARTLAGAIRLSSAIVLPGVLVAFAAMVKLRTVPGALHGLTLALLTLPYAALLGSALALLARLSSRLLPGHGRWLFIGLTLGPWLLALATDTSIPSLPGACGWLLGQLTRSLR